MALLYFNHSVIDSIIAFWNSIGNIYIVLQTGQR